MTQVEILTAPPLLTIQDAGRLNALQYGISASGPMDNVSYNELCLSLAQQNLIVMEAGGGRLSLKIKHCDAPIKFAWGGTGFECHVNGKLVSARKDTSISENDIIDLLPTSGGNFAYIGFDRGFDVPEILGSRSTNLVANLGGFEGRNVKAGDTIELMQPELRLPGGALPQTKPIAPSNEPLRFVWGLHADLFSNDVRQKFCTASFKVSTAINRMGFRLIDQNGVFGDFENLSLVSDPVVAGDIQILGDGTPTVLMRDHQPTGGYPRIGTLISADLSRFAQMTPGTQIQFKPVSLDHMAKLGHAIV